MNASSDLLFPWNDILIQSQKDFAIDGKDVFTFQVRRRTNVPDFDALLERQIRSIKGLEVVRYRTVKEGFARVARPAEISFSVEVLFFHQPETRLKTEMLRKIFDQEKEIDLRQFCSLYFSDVWDDLLHFQECLKIFNYLVQRQDKVAGMAPREIPHGLSTKLIGKDVLLLRLFTFWNSTLVQWKDVFYYFGIQKRPTEYRLFAPDCFLQNQELKSFHGIISSENLLSFNFKNLKGTLIIENLESFYQVVPLSSSVLILWGAGWKVAGLVPWMDKLPSPVAYWGDLDKEGFEIMAYLQRHKKDLKILSMDMNTLQKNVKLWQKKEPYLGPFTFTPDHQEVYEFVCRQGLRLEQEHLGVPFDLQEWLKHPIDLKNKPSVNPASP